VPNESIFHERAVHHFAVEFLVHGLQVLAVKRLSHGLDFQASYTYSRSIDTTAGQMYNTDCGGGAIGTAVGFNPPT